MMNNKNDITMQESIEFSLIGLLRKLSIINTKNKTYPSTIKKISKTLDELSLMLDNNSQENSKFKDQINNAYQNWFEPKSLTVFNELLISKISPNKIKYFYPNSKTISKLVFHSFDHYDHDYKSNIEILDYVLTNMNPSKNISKKTMEDFFNNFIFNGHTIKKDFIDRILKIPLLNDKIKNFKGVIKFSLIDFLIDTDQIGYSKFKIYKSVSKPNKNIEYINSFDLFPKNIVNTIKAISHVDNLSSLNDIEFLPSEKLTKANKKVLEEEYEYSDDEIEKVEKLIDEWNVFSEKSLIKNKITNSNIKSHKKRKF